MVLCTFSIEHCKVAMDSWHKYDPEYDLIVTMEDGLEFIQEVLIRLGCCFVRKC